MLASLPRISDKSPLWLIDSPAAVNQSDPTKGLAPLYEVGYVLHSHERLEETAYLVYSAP